MAQVMDALKENLGDKIIDIEKVRDNRIYMKIAPEDVLEVIQYLFFDYKCKFVTATGLDTREGIEIIYHLAKEECKMLINVKILIPYPELSINSVGKNIPAFRWIEREIHEMLGVEFKGHPDQRRLLLADSFPKGKYPLRKDFKNSDISDEDYDYKRSGL